MQRSVLLDLVQGLVPPAYIFSAKLVMFVPHISLYLMMILISSCDAVKQKASQAVLFISV